MYHEESAIRSTQTSPKKTVDPVNLQPSSHNLQSGIDRWKAMNQIPKPRPVPQTRSKIGKRAAQHVEPEIVDVEEDVNDAHVDTDDGNDSVYMIHAKEGSWSASLPSEDDPEVQACLPPQAELAIQHIKRAQKLVEQQQRQNLADTAASALGQHSQSSDDAPDDSAKWQNDLLLHNVIRQIKQRLREGAILTLECLGPINFTVTCAHPQCPAPGTFIPPGAYYFVLGQLRQLDDASQYCLFCLEGLWSGKGMAGTLPDPQVSEESTIQHKHQVPSFSLDGATDDARFAAADITSSLTTPSSLLSTPCSASRPSSSHAVSTPATQFSDLGTTSPTPPSSEIDASLLTESPLSRKATKSGCVSRTAHDVIDESGETLLDRLKRSSPGSTIWLNTDESNPVRRSSRLA